MQLCTGYARYMHCPIVYLDRKMQGRVLVVLEEYVGYSAAVMRCDDSHIAHRRISLYAFAIRGTMTYHISDLTHTIRYILCETWGI
jgi:hypothetical protein